MISVLVVEDEKHLADGLKFNLEAEGYTVDVAGDGESALESIKARPGNYDVVVLDVMLPGIDGFSVVSQLRASGDFVPVMMLTARGRPEDVLRGFESGADDYLPKPFELTILNARLHGLIRRSRWQQERITQGEQRETSTAPRLEIDVNAGDEQNDMAPLEREYNFAGKSIDFDALEIRYLDKTVRLTLMEVGLLRYLIRNAGRVVSRKAVLEDVWNLREDTDTRAIDNFIVRLRRYIEDDPSHPRHLLTVRGVGYRFVPNP
jgi:DNA-binding response OmpR family regulator